MLWLNSRIAGTWACHRLSIPGVENWRSPKHFSRSHCASWCCCGLFRKHHANHAACRLVLFYFYSCSVIMLVCIDQIVPLVKLLHFAFVFSFNLSHWVETLTAMSLYFFYVLTRFYPRYPTPTRTFIIIYFRQWRPKFARLHQTVVRECELENRSCHVMSYNDPESDNEFITPFWPVECLGLNLV